MSDSIDPFVRRMTGTTAHGGMPFDVPFVSHIEGNLWQGGCENGLVLPRIFQHVVSLYPWEQYEITHQLRSYSLHWLYDADEHPPAVVHAIADWVEWCVGDGPTLLHCQAGLNRSSLVAAMVLINGGRSAEEAISMLREKRSPAVLCNPAFEAFLRRLA